MNRPLTDEFTVEIGRAEPLQKVQKVLEADSKTFVLFGAYAYSMTPKKHSGNTTQSNRSVGRSRKKNSGGSGGTHQNAGRSNVVPYKKSINLNIGMILFGVVLVYVVYSIIRSLTAKHIVGYEVRTGSISSNQVYQGLCLRQEEVVTSDYSGYINYYSPETDRLATGKLAYTIDESGQVQSSLIQDSDGSSLLSSDNYSSLVSDIVSFEESFRPSDFQSVYEFKTSLTGTIQKMANRSILSDLSSLSSSSLHYCNTTDTGYIVYSVDGYEEKSFADLVTGDFDATNYTKTELTNGSLIAQGDPAYKLEVSEDWEIAIQVSSREDAEALQELGVVKVRFLKNQYESWATIGEIRDPGDGHYLVQLTFTNSMMAFCTDRFLSVELQLDTTKGLKIPKSALIDDTFYVVPTDYVTVGVGEEEGVLRQIIDADGEKSTEFISVTPYTNEDDPDHYYLSQDTLRDGDVLIKPDSAETLTLSSSLTDTLTGVYNINKGYADFRQVTKIAENDEYAIVKANSTYGLREYDYIVLNAGSLSPDEFLYE